MKVYRLLVPAVILAFTFAVSAAPPPAQTFATPVEAVEALINALKLNDLDKLRAMFGPAADELFRSKDSVADRSMRNTFVGAYQVNRVLMDNPDGTKTLLVGTVAWPFPVPIVPTGARWQYDPTTSVAGVLERRIEWNEYSMIRTLKAIVTAQHQYYSRDYDRDGVLEYAQIFRSQVMTQDGLWWAAKKGQPESPMSEYMANSLELGYTVGSTTLHGYKFKRLFSQGANAPGGKLDYMTGRDMVNGFAFVAYPAVYKNTGIRTFMVGQTGQIYERDLGADADQFILELTSFDPGPGWSKLTKQ